jgi:hypothetical protein
MQSIKNNSIIKRKNDIVFNKLDDEIVMMSIKNGQYYGLDNIATRIYELIEIPTTFENLIKKLIEEFDVEIDICNKDVVSFLLLLAEKEIIVID